MASAFGGQRSIQLSYGCRAAAYRASRLPPQLQILCSAPLASDGLLVTIA